MVHLQGNTKWHMIEKPMKYFHIISYPTYISKNMRKLNLVTTENYGMNQTFIRNTARSLQKLEACSPIHVFSKVPAARPLTGHSLAHSRIFFHLWGHLVVQPLSFQRGTCNGVSTSNDPTALRVMIKIQQSSSKMELYGRMPLRETVLNKLIQVWVLHLWKMLPMMLILACNNMLNFQLVTMHRACIWHWWHWSLSVVLALAFARNISAGYSANTLRQS